MDNYKSSVVENYYHSIEPAPTKNISDLKLWKDCSADYNGGERAVLNSNSELFMRVTLHNWTNSSVTVSNTNFYAYRNFSIVGEFKSVAQGM
ncbi:MAG: hypothetical protein LUF85_07730 [Bacteroides sp.]|nr:hypothetical protein [Bacteroides sp.]